MTEEPSLFEIKNPLPEKVADSFFFNCFNQLLKGGDAPSLSFSGLVRRHHNLNEVTGFKDFLEHFLYALR